MLLFVALQLLEGRAGGIVGHAVSLLARAQPQIGEREALGSRYRLIQAPSRGGTPDWAAIAGLAMTDALLLPDKTAPPADIPLHPLRCPRFERKVLLATACEVVKRTRMPMYRRVVGLLDPDGRHTRILFPLLHHYTAVRVVTAAADRYRQAAADITDRLGDPVVWGPDPSLLEGCVLILAPGPAPGVSAAPLPAPVLAGPGFSPPPGCEVFGGLQAMVEPALAALCPPGIAPTALQRRCTTTAVPTPGGMSPTRCRSAHGPATCQPVCAP